MKLEWVPEYFPASGGLSAKGFAKLLGRPKLDPLSVLVRETAQNSWDARDGTDNPVDFHIHGGRLAGSVRRSLREQIFPDVTHLEGVPLEKCLSADDLVGLYISDRHTKGLGGPVQANQVDPDEVYDWADFILNVGKANMQEHTGGTYGFGKTIAYVVSSANTIITHTKTMYLGKPVTRLIASAIGSQFTLDGTLCTGRHWWGAQLRGGPVPVEGAIAESIAADVGMPPFGENEFGTNILVLAPDFGGRTVAQGMTFLAESITWHLWPKMITLAGSLPMQFTVSWESVPVCVPRPEQRPPLDAFAAAFRSLASKQDASELPAGLQRHVIGRERPKTVVGELVTLPFLAQRRPEIDDGSQQENPDGPRPASPFQDQACHHVALMRTPELIVDYVEGPAAPEADIEWAGVFRVDDQHDDVFAQSEPPTHDSWQPALLPDRTSKSIVSKALRDVQSIVSARWGAVSPATPRSTSSTAVVADALGHLLGPIGGQGKGRSTAPGGGRGQITQGARVEVLGSGPMLQDGHPATFVRLRIRPKRQAVSTSVYISVGIALDSTVSDATLDPRLELVKATLSDRTERLRGHSAHIELSGSLSRDIEIVARRSSSSSLLWEVRTDEGRKTEVAS